MPYNPSTGVFSLPAIYLAIPGTVIIAAQHNEPLQDLATANNYARPVIAGGTGANNAASAATNLNVLSKAGDTMAGGIDMDGNSLTDALLDGIPGGKFIAGYLYGLTLSNNGVDAANDIDIAIGAASSDGTVPYLMSRDASLTKRLDALWAVGSNNGGLDAGTVTNATYHVWLIQRSDTGVVDALFSLSATAPTMPTNYDRKRRIGSIIRSGGTILAFTQNGNTFILNVAVMNRTSNAAQASTLLALTVPGGIVVQPIMVSTQQQNATGNVQTRFANAGGNLATLVTTVANQEIGQAYIPSGIFTDTSGRIQYSVEFLGGTLLSNELLTKGWIDTRGQEG
ncbi:hypothetical protein [Agrobacterium sp. ST15.13.015]|uniref:hypothetical protein n=1 Tax=Agrobacterium sp. ST15.13.015 TaxID=3017319 RepID=UPI0022C36E32|nr:hypothetical protein [Agrobacterium sp. ST15.13.015]MCZ7498860.1 hypothetical protein [Rhizobium rhizogenes]